MKNKCPLLLLPAFMLLFACSPMLRYSKAFKNSLAGKSADTYELPLKEETKTTNPAFKQLPPPGPVNRYTQALQELEVMLNSNKSVSLKKAVFLVEQAYLGTALQYESFDEKIRFLAGLCRQWMQANAPAHYPYPDSLNMLGNAAITRLLNDTLRQCISFLQFYHLPMQYRLDDAEGRKRWSHTFLSQLLQSGQGTCHSLPLLYKILADELGVQAWLGQTLNHRYVICKSKAKGWYCYDPGSAQCMSEAQMMTRSYTSLQAIKSGLFMDTLGSRRLVALCLIDLAHGYHQRLGRDKFERHCVDLSLQHYPDNVNALLYLAEWSREATELAGLSPRSQAPLPPLAEKSYLHLLDLGYREMPSTMLYNQRMEQESEKARRAGKIPPRWERQYFRRGSGTLTLSNGYYEEFFDQDSLQRIGSAIIHLQKRQVIQYLPLRAFNSDSLPLPGISSRWFSVDPLQQKYPSLSPYNFVANNPIVFVDPDGRKIIIGKQDQSYFLQDMQKIFGDLACNIFYFDPETDELKMNPGKGLGLTTEQQVVYEALIHVVNEQDHKTNIFYIEGPVMDKNGNYLYDKKKPGSVLDVRNHGGEVTLPDESTDRSGEDNVYIFKYDVSITTIPTEMQAKPAPRAPTGPELASGTKQPMIDYSRDAPMPKKLGPHKLIDPRAANVVHGIGHAIYEGKPQGQVIDLDNNARKAAGYKTRDYDKEHPDPNK